MKRILCLLLATCSIYLNGSSQCVIDTSLTQIGFYPSPDSQDCVEQNVAYSGTIQFVTPGTFDTFGLTLTVDTVRITDISGLPNGITYACNPTDCAVVGGQNACVNFSGTTTDPIGQYPLTVTAQVTATVPVLGPQTVEIDLSILGINYYLTVIKQGGVCPPLSVSISGTTEICTGDQTTLSADVVNASGNETYLWTPGGDQNPQINVSDTGVYSVQVIDQGDTVSASVTVTIETAPVAGFSVAVNGQVADFTSTSANGDTYLWNFGDPTSGSDNTSMDENPSHIYTGIGTYTVTLTVDNSCDTDDTTAQVTIQSLSPCFPDTVTRAPGVYPGPDSIPCVERGVAFDFTMQTHNFAAIGGLIPVNWTRIDSVENLPCGISWASNKTQYAPGEKGCIQVSGTSREVVGQYPLRIYMTLEVDVPVLGVQAPSGELNSLIEQLNGILAIVGQPPLTVDYKYVSRVVEAGDNCPARDINSVLEASGDVCPAFSVDITGSSVICSGTPTSLTAMPKYYAGNLSAVTYLWSPGNDTAATISAAQAGTYTVVVTEQGGGTATSSITVTEGSAPTAGFNVSVDRYIATITQNTTTGGATSYSWNWGDNSPNSSGQIPPPHTYTSNGNFTITLTASNVCGDGTATQQVTTTGVFIQPIENNLEFEVHPNPSTGYFNLTLTNNDLKPVTLRIFDLSGKLVYTEPINEINSVVKRQIDLSALPKGVYSLHLSSEAGNGIQRLTIY